MHLFPTLYQQLLLYSQTWEDTKTCFEVWAVFLPGIFSSLLSGGDGEGAELMNSVVCWLALPSGTFQTATEFLTLLILLPPLCSQPHPSSHTPISNSYFQGRIFFLSFFFSGSSSQATFSWYIISLGFIGWNLTSGLTEPWFLASQRMLLMRATWSYWLPWLTLPSPHADPHASSSWLSGVHFQKWGTPVHILYL